MVSPCPHEEAQTQSGPCQSQISREQATEPCNNPRLNTHLALLTPIWVLLQDNSPTQVLLLVSFIPGRTLLKNDDGKHSQTLNKTWRTCCSPGAGQRVIRKAVFLSHRNTIFPTEKTCNRFHQEFSCFHYTPSILFPSNILTTAKEIHLAAFLLPVTLGVGK